MNLIPTLLSVSLSYEVIMAANAYQLLLDSTLLTVINLAVAS